MHWIDWVIAIVPVCIILGVAVYSRKYVRGVVDYIASGRVAGRYVICIAELSTGLSVISLVALCEAKYQTGLALAFWEFIIMPIGLIVALTGFCFYRFRETKALSNGQFLEIRYNRSLRIFGSFLRILAEMLTNAIGPAIAARFFIYFLGIPHEINCFGFQVPSFMLVVSIVLAMAVLVMWFGGRIALLITDCFQGLLSYPIFVLIVVFVLYTFSWSKEIAPVMLDRVPGENFLNPLDISKLRDFNIFSLVVIICGMILNRASFAGNDTTSAGRTPHEQKMAGILSGWRSGFSILMCLLVAITVITVMNHEHFAPQAREIRTELSAKVSEEVIPRQEQRNELNRKIAAIPEQHHRIGIDAPLSRSANLDSVYLDTARETLGGDGNGNLNFQKFRTLYNQMMMPLALRKMLPTGLLGVFCLLMIMLMLSTDDSRIFNASVAIIQDLVLPFRKTPLSPQQHLKYLKICTLLVSFFFFFCSIFLSQLDYINMFLVIMVAMWLGGAGPVMVFGLYTRWGTTAGAFSAIFVGSGISLGGMLLQRSWANIVYPFLAKMGWVDTIGSFLAAVSQPFNPYIVWEMDAVKFPINSYELYFFAMVFGVGAYIIGSMVTYRKPYNLERMLHRGKYAIDGEKKIDSAWTWKSVWGKLIGITPEYTCGDKFIAWSLFIYSFIYQLGICFGAVLIWNMISPWPQYWWSQYFFITSLLVAGIIGVISTVWFLWGGIVDAKRLFRDLAARVDDPLDDGRVEGHVSLMDKAKLGSDDKE